MIVQTTARKHVGLCTANYSVRNNVQLRYAESTRGRRSFLVHVACSLNSLEFLACSCPIIAIYFNLSETSETLLLHHQSFPDIIVQHCRILLRYRGPRNGYCCLAHVKNH